MGYLKYRARPCIILAAAVLALGFINSLIPLRAEEMQWDRTGWRDPAWRYRLVVETADAPPEAGWDVAKVTMGQDSALCMANGDDIRVVTPDGSLVPHRVVQDGDNELHVLFTAGRPRRHYVIYFGNPEARPPDEVKSEAPPPGGLTLETLRSPQRIYRADNIPKALEAAGESYGKGLQDAINHRHNPFGPDRDYLAVYRGMLYAPETGEYTFAVKARDAAVFRLFRGSEEILLCRQDAVIPGEGWHIPGQDHARKTIHLQEGWYGLHYNHAANAGPHLAKLGWQTPSCKTINPVPPEAFPRYIPARPVARETFGERLNSFFRIEHLYDLSAIDGNILFHHFRLTAGDYICPEQGRLSYLWNFGGTRTREGKQVQIDWPADAGFKVSLQASDKQGNESTLSRNVIPGRRAVIELDYDIRIRPAAGSMVLAPKQSLPFELSLRNNTMLHRELSCHITDGDGGHDLEILEAGSPEPAEDGGGWLNFVRQLPAPREDTSLYFRLKLHGRTVRERRISLFRAGGPVEGLRLDKRGNLTDGNGDPALLLLNGIGMEDVPLRRYVRGDRDSVRIVVLDSLHRHSVPDIEMSYLESLKAGLESIYRPLSFEIITVGIHNQTPAELFFVTRQIMEKHDPDLLMLAGHLGDTTELPQPVEFERFLAAMMEQVLARTRTALIVVTPPPLPDMMFSARTLSRAAKRAAFLKGVPTADLHSRFMLQPVSGDYFGVSGGRRLLNQKAHDLIAEDILSTIRRSMNAELYDAARRASL